VPQPARLRTYFLKRKHEVALSFLLHCEKHLHFFHPVPATEMLNLAIWEIVKVLAKNKSLPNDV